MSRTRQHQSLPRARGRWHPPSPARRMTDEVPVLTRGQTARTAAPPHPRRDDHRSSASDSSVPAIGRTSNARPYGRHTLRTHRRGGGLSPPGSSILFQIERFGEFADSTNPRTVFCISHLPHRRPRGSPLWRRRERRRLMPSLLSSRRAFLPSCRPQGPPPRRLLAPPPGELSCGVSRSAA